MKIHVAWLLLVATYFFCFGVAVSHDWDWMALEYTSHSMFTDRWFVNTAQIATIGTPFILLVLIGTDKWLDALSDAVHGEPRSSRGRIHYGDAEE